MRSKLMRAIPSSAGGTATAGLADRRDDGLGFDQSHGHPGVQDTRSYKRDARADARLTDRR